MSHDPQEVDRIALEKLYSYEIEIREWGMLFDNKYVITTDSIIINYSVIKRPARFAKEVTEGHARSICSSLEKVDMKNMKESYVDNHAPDDMPEYDFRIIRNDETKEFHIYQVKLDEIFNLVAEINKILPKEHRVGYDKEYFRYKKEKK